VFTRRAAFIQRAEFTRHAGLIQQPFSSNTSFIEEL
jgi:hypothetical protein